MRRRPTNREKELFVHSSEVKHLHSTTKRAKEGKQRATYPSCSMVILSATIPIGRHAMVVPLTNGGLRLWLGLIAACLIWSLFEGPAGAFDGWTVGLNGYQPRREDAAY